MNSFYRLRSLAACCFILILTISGIGCSSWMRLKRSPFSGLLPPSTPLIIEGTPGDVSNFLRRMEIAVPSLGGGPDIGSLDCDRLLYAAVPPENNGDFAACRITLMQTVNSLEEIWTEQMRYPASEEAVLPQCPFGGQMVYASDGQQFTLTCSGEGHKTQYNSLTGLSTRNADSKPLVFIAFQSDDPQWQDAAISKKHPKIKILTSDPQRTAAFLEQSENGMEIVYPRHTSLYASVLNERLSDFWTGLPLTLPGERSIITKNDQTGVYSLRSPIAAEENQAPAELPSVDSCWKQLPQGSARIAVSCELLRQLNLLPWQLQSSDRPQPLVFGITSNNISHISRLLPTVNSAFSGLSEAVIAARFADKNAAEQGLRNSPWGDLSKDGNPYCRGEQNGDILSISIGEKLPASSAAALPLPQGPGPLQLAGQFTVTDNAQNTQTYSISGGVRGNEFWLEVNPHSAPERSSN